MSPRDYPAVLENYWMRRARETTGCADDETALEKLRPAVQALSDLFTTDRPGEFPDYAADTAKRIAYGLFFFPQSYVRCALALDPLLKFRGWKPEGDGPVRILDLGAASGPCGFAAARLLAETTGRNIILTAFDKSASALAELREIVASVPEIRATVNVGTLLGDMRRAGEVLRELPPQDLIVAGFAANELFGGADTGTRLDWTRTLAARLTGSGVLLFLEPALRETAEPLRRLREATLAGPELFPLGPDVGPTPCPMLASGGKFWDHEVREWTAPDSTAFLNRKLHRDLRVLKFATAAFSRKPQPVPENPRHIFRIVSPFEAQKGGFAFSAITREGEAVKIDIPSRGLSKNECKNFAASWERGDIAGCERLVPLTNPGNFRIPGPGDLKKIYSP